MLDKISLILVIIGALNWGSIGLFQFDIVGWICGGQDSIVARIIFTLVALAGPFGNVITAFVCIHFARLFPALFTSYGAIGFLRAMIYTNIGLAAFNLIPIPPLDGSRILFLFLPPRLSYLWYRLEQYGIFIVLLLLATNILPVIMNPIFTLLFRLVFI